MSDTQENYIKNRLVNDYSLQLYGFPGSSILNRENTPQGSHFNRKGLADCFIFLSTSLLGVITDSRAIPSKFDVPFKINSFSTFDKVLKIIPKFINDWASRMPHVKPVNYNHVGEPMESVVFQKIIKGGIGDYDYIMQAETSSKVFNIFGDNTDIENFLRGVGLDNKNKIVLINMKVKDIDKQTVAKGVIIIHTQKMLLSVLPIL